MSRPQSPSISSSSEPDIVVLLHPPADPTLPEQVQLVSSSSDPPPPIVPIPVPGIAAGPAPGPAPGPANNYNGIFDADPDSSDPSDSDSDDDESDPPASDEDDNGILHLLPHQFDSDDDDILLNLFQE